jgi:hypothetical protein
MPGASAAEPAVATCAGKCDTCAAAELVYYGDSESAHWQPLAVHSG